MLDDCPRWFIPILKTQVMAQELKITISELKSKDPVKGVGKSEHFPQDHFPVIFVGCFPFLPVHARVLADWFADITANSKARHWGQQELQIKGLFILFLKWLEKKVRHSALRKQKQFWSWVKTQRSKLVRKSGSRNPERKEMRGEWANRSLSSETVSENLTHIVVVKHQAPWLGVVTSIS